MPDDWRPPPDAADPRQPPQAANPLLLGCLVPIALCVLLYLVGLLVGPALSRTELSPVVAYLGVVVRLAFVWLPVAWALVVWALWFGRRS